MLEIKYELLSLVHLRSRRQRLIVQLTIITNGIQVLVLYNPLFPYLIVLFIKYNLLSLLNYLAWLCLHNLHLFLLFSRTLINSITTIHIGHEFPHILNSQNLVITYIISILYFGDRIVLPQLFVPKNTCNSILSLYFVIQLIIIPTSLLFLLFLVLHFFPFVGRIRHQILLLITVRSVSISIVPFIVMFIDIIISMILFNLFMGHRCLLVLLFLVLDSLFSINFSPQFLDFLFRKIIIRFTIIITTLWVFCISLQLFVHIFYLILIGLLIQFV